MTLYYILKPIVFLLNHTPRRILHIIAKFMAFSLWHLSKDRRHVAITNAKILEAKDPIKTARLSFTYTFMAYVDIFYAKRINDKYIKNHTTLENKEVYEKVKDEAFVFVGSHFGTWSLLPNLGPKVLSTKAITIGRSTKNKALDKIIEELRTFERTRYVTHRGAIDKLTAYINDGYMPGVYIDHTATEKDCINANFCGYKVPVIAGIPALCVRKNYPIIMIFSLYDKNPMDTKIILKGPIYPDRTLSVKERVMKLAEDINKIYEEVFKEHPEQWYLIHRRFKRVALEDGTMSNYVYKTGEI